MRGFFTLVTLFVTGCGPILSTIPHVGGAPEGPVYVLPMGLVPIQVFVDEKGIGLTIGPARMVADNEPGTLVARLTSSPFNNQDIKIGVDPSTGFLKTISSDADAQLLAIVEEAAKTAGRLAFQNSQAALLAERVVVFEDNLDPLRQTDVKRINRRLDAAFQRAEMAFNTAKDTTLASLEVKLSVLHSNGKPIAKILEPVNTSGCAAGLCVRAMTTRIIRVHVDTVLLGSMPVTIPSREAIGVPVPSTVLADQDITIGITDGVLEKYELKRDSEVLGLVKLPGAILSGLVAGVTQGLTDEKSIVDKRRDVAESEEALTKAIANRNTAATEVGESGIDLENTAATEVGESGIDLENTAGGAKRGIYTAVTLTVYPHSETLAQLIGSTVEPNSELPEDGNPDLVAPPPSHPQAAGP